jgi:hypothetical protein
MSLPAVAAACAALAVLLMWKRSEWRRTQALLMLVAGLALGGLVDGWREAIADLAADASASATAKLFGVGVPYVAALFVVAWFALDMDIDGLVNKMRKKGGKGKNKYTTTGFTPWLALLVPVMLAVLPVVGDTPELARGIVADVAAEAGR